MGTGIGYSFIGACALAFLAIAHARAMKMKEQHRFAEEYFWYAGGMVPLALACVFLASNGDLPMIPQRFLMFSIGALLGGSLLLGIGELIRPGSVAMAQSQPPSNSMGPVIDNYGIVTQGQNGNNVVVQGVVPRHLGDQDKEALLARIPIDRKISIVFVLNDSDATDLAMEYAAFLRKSGYSVDGPSGAMIWTSENTSPRGVNVNLNLDVPQNPVQITVGIRK